MIVNRVFCYSKEVAKKNGNKQPILKLILTILLGMIGLLVLIESNKELNMPLYTIIVIVWITFFVYYSTILCIRKENRLTAYATDTSGRIFKVMAVNNGQGLYFGGLAAGRTIDRLTHNNKRTGEHIGGIIGAVAEIYAEERSAEYMSHPEIVAKMVESAPNITGAEVFEILKVYSITDKKKSVKVNCDYKILRTNKIKYAKNLTIQKSFNMYEDLISILNTHR